jgi:hypothetical protein
MTTSGKKKPNRSKVRYFTPCDAARIARQVTFDDPELTPENVMACIAKGFGFTHISLSRITAVESSIGGNIQLGKVILEKTIPLLEKLLSKLPGGIGRWGTILAALKKALDFIQRTDIPDIPQGPVDDWVNKCDCKYSTGDISNGYKNIT